MEKWLQKLSGAAFASLLAVTLSGRAYADEIPPALPGPDGPEAGIQAQTAEDAAPASEESAAPEADAPAPVSASAENNVPSMEEQTVPAEQMLRNSSAPLAAPGADSNDGDNADGEESDGGDVEESGATVDEDGLIHACYPLTEGGYIFVNYSAEDQDFTSSGDLIVLAAGVNHIPTLSSATGKIYVGGSGFLLVDRLDGELEFLFDTELYPDIEGSAAVFVKQTDGSYRLANGGVQGILDEAYDIRDVTLVVPEGECLRLQSISTITESYVPETAGGGTPEAVIETRYSTDQELITPAHPGGEVLNQCTTTGSLLINKGAQLIFEKAAQLIYDSLWNTMEGFEWRPEFKVAGTLTLNGDLDGCTVELLDGAVVNGPGSLTHSAIEVNPERSTPASLKIGEGSELYLGLRNKQTDVEAANLGTLTVTGNSTLQIPRNRTVGSIVVENGATLVCRCAGDLGSDISLTLTGSVSGDGTVLLDRGNFIFAEGFAADDAAIAASHTDEEGNTVRHAVQIYDYTNGACGASSLLADAKPAALSPDMALTGVSTEDGALVIQTATLEIAQDTMDGTVVEDVFVSYDEESSRAFRFEESKRDSLILNYALLAEYYADEIAAFAANPAENHVKIVQFLVETWDGERFVKTLLQDPVWEYLSEGEQPPSVAAKNVSRILIIKSDLDPQATVQPGIALTGTNISPTGSGILGGAGAGSVRYGRSTFHVGTPVEPDPVKPDPVKPDPVKPDPIKPDPIEPEKKHGGGETAQYLLVWVEEAENGSYRLIAERSGTRVERFNGLVELSMDYTPPSGWNGESIYIVFRSADGSYAAFEARYDPVTGKLYFETDRAGAFVVVAMDYKGDAFTTAFYETLAKQIEVEALP